MVIVTTSTAYGGRILTVVVTGLDLAAEASDEIDMQAEMSDSTLLYGYPRSCTLQAARTAGTTDTVEVNLIGSNITTIFGYTTGGDDTTTMASAVSSTGSDPVGETDLDPYRYWKIVVETIGAGNTLTATAVFQFGP